MRKLFIFLLGVMLSAQTVYSQPVIQTWTEDFDNIVSATSAPPGFTTIPQGSWVSDPVHYLPGSSVANPKSFLGLVPTTLGSTTILQTPVYDLSNMSCVLLRFSHICKVSPKDSALLQYRDVAGPPVWTTVRADAYLGKAATVARGFSASSYPEWQAGDSMAIPDQSWWKEEYFDLSQVASYGRFEFRFIIKRMNVQGTQASYGWLLENFELTASPVQIYPPVVEFIAPLVKDNVYYTGPFEINARVKTQTNAPIVPPKLVYTSTFNGTSVTDSVPMTNVLGDSLWKADIPQFVLGTQVTYYITGRDTLGNQASDTSGFVIMYGTGGNVIVGTGTTNNYYTPINLWYQYSWTRQLYLGSELIPGAMGGIISKLAWDYNYTNAWTVTKQTCYFRAVDETTQATGYIDPLADGATEVWSGTLSVAGGPAWVEITLDQPFFLPQDKNLLIYWHHESGNYPGSAWVFRHHTTASNQTVYAMSTVSFPATSAGTVTTARPNARFTIVNTTVNNHSVELSSIDMSDTVIVTPSVSVPVVATIKNKGASNLTSARIYYSVNGNTPQYFTWSGNLSWDYTTQASNASATYVP
ncbi:MAG: hypothetical protein LBQ64_03540, partial [Bacteroidales bacterium]|nr:hypothetical protein [Bacteroidales bacterium]